MNKIVSLAVLMAISSVSLATNTPQTQQPVSNSSAGAGATAGAGAEANSGSVSKSGSISAVGDTASKSLSGASNSTTVKSTGEVSVGYQGDVNTYRSRALALSLPGVVAAPAVAGVCLEHLRGGGAASIGVTGRTKLNELCMQREQCLAVADRMFAWGARTDALRQLATCGGIDAKLDPTPTEPQAPTNLKVFTPEELAERDRQIIIKASGK